MEENQTEERKFNFQDTEATKKIFRLKKRIRAVCGGTSASKTISILVWCIDYAQANKDKKIDVMSESYPHLEDGAIKDFQLIMKDRGYWNSENWNSTKHTYTFETGSVLKFISIDNLGKAHGPRRDVLFINEANNIDYNIYDQLEVRTKDVVWFDWNPSTEFWYYTEIKGKIEHDFLTLTYLDCLDVLPASIINSIESKKTRKNWWKVYGLGELGEVEGKIYKDWLFIDEVPHEARLVRYGVDFGYTNDPTAIVAVYQYNGGYIFDEKCYLHGMSNRQIADVFKTCDRAMIIADSAEPKSIDEIKNYGVFIQPAQKGQGSVKQGIQFIQDQRVSVTKRSLNLIREYRNYLWLIDKNGKLLNEPESGDDHALDAIRYALETYRPRNFLKKERVKHPKREVMLKMA